MSSHPDCTASIYFVIEGLEEKFEIHCFTQCREMIKYLKKILLGEVRLRSKYCSQIFYCENSDGSHYPNNFNDLDVFDERNSDKIYLFSLATSEFDYPNTLYLISLEDGCALGISLGQIQLLKKIICPKSNYRVADIYCEFRDIDVNDSNDVVFTGEEDY